MTPPNRGRVLGDLERLAGRTPRSGREAQAVSQALRTLERISRPRNIPPMPEGWHPGGPFEELDACDSVATRERWWRSLHDPLQAGETT